MKEGSGEWAGVKVQLQNFKGLNHLQPVPLSRHSQLFQLSVGNFLQPMKSQLLYNKNSSCEVSVSN